MKLLSISRRHLLTAAVIAAAVIAAFGIVPRIKAEQSNKTVAFVTEYRDIMSLSVQSGLSPDAIWRKIHALGVQGISISEYTGEELSLINPLPIKYVPAAQLGIDLDGVLPDRAVIAVDKSYKDAELLCSYIKIKMPGTIRDDIGNRLIMILPGNMDDFKQSSFIPDLIALDFCKSKDVPVLFRPGPCPPSGGQESADALHFLIGNYPQIRNIVPSGMVMAGYPDYEPIAKTLRRDGVTFSQVEFVKQVGVAGFAKLMSPAVITLHSLTKDEIISRTIPRRQIVERFVRAVHERSVRFIMMHPYDLQMGDRLSVFIDDLSVTKEAIEARGYAFGWPAHLPAWPVSLAGAVACGLSLIFCAWFYNVRLRGLEDAAAGVPEVILLVLASIAVAFAMWKIPVAARLCGGICGAMIAAEAAMTALESSKRPLSGSILGLLIIMAGGLSIASFYGTISAALRLTPFSGVKLTLLLPPLLLLVHDLKRRVHPESIAEIVKRPAIWGELFLIGVMMLALLVMALRSDNVSNVPALEVAFRDFMERTLLVRPRTKEFLIGYPALVVYWYLVRKGWGSKYREALRIAAVLAFCSALNTFCHFHTLLSLSVIRVINGWWLGMIIGIAAVAVINFIAVPLWKKKLGDIFD